MNVLDIFSGIGGFTLGLQTAGFHTVAFCEIDPYCQRVLARHWPTIPCYTDIRDLNANRLAVDGVARIDLIAGGFPCQDISSAGKGAGLAGSRSGLWSEFARLVRELRPRYVIVENVSALLARGLGDVLGELAALGYDAEWHCIPACAVGAPHRRDRIWIIAYPERDELRHEPGRRHGTSRTDSPELTDDGQARSVAYADGSGRAPRRGQPQPSSSESAGHVANADGARQLEPQGSERGKRGWSGDGGASMADAASTGLSHAGLGGTEAEPGGERESGAGGWWDAEPDVGRVAHGIPARVDRLKSLGNAVVPQVVELLARAIAREAA